MAINTICCTVEGTQIQNKQGKCHDQYIQYKFMELVYYAKSMKRQYFSNQDFLG